MRINPNKTYIQYTGAKPMCIMCKKDGILRLQKLKDRKLASQNTIILCDNCFKQVFK